MSSPRWLRAWSLALALPACGGGSDDAGLAEAETETGDDAGSLCACREVEGELECCFGHGVCEAQPEGPSVCACDPGARGRTCATPGPGVHPVRARSCPGPEPDPGCDQLVQAVVVEAFDACVDPGSGATFEGVLVRPAADLDGAWPPPETWAEGAAPVALLVHGASQDFADYYDLLEHLAANGVVAAAFDGTAGEGATFRANRALAFSNCLRETWADAGLLSPRHALVGHSRGGAAVSLVARALAEGGLPLAGLEGLELEAVVALAPTAYGSTNSEGSPALTASDAPAYLAVQGSRDPDTGGAALGWFEESDPAMLRGQVWIHGATHQRFNQGLLFAGTGELEASLDAEAHWAAARAYVGGFVLWRLLGLEGYRPYFAGQAVPASVPAEVFAGLGDGGGGRLLVHDFEAPSLEPSSVGGAVLVDGLEPAALTLGPLAELDAPWSGAHRSAGLSVDASGSPGEGEGEATLAFELPPAVADVGGYAALSLRLGWAFDDPENCGPRPEAAELGALALALSDGASTAVVPLDSLGEAGRVEAPDRFAPETFGNWTTPECHALDALRPLRVDLARFCEVEPSLDLGALTRVELRVSPGSAGVALMLDDLALERGEGEVGVGACAPP